jgi:hypothetical protein
LILRQVIQPLAQEHCITKRQLCQGFLAEQIKRCNKVYLDFTRNPKGLENGFNALPEEAYTYLERSGALFGTPIERLEKMNIGAIELYADLTYAGSRAVV